MQNARGSALKISFEDGTREIAIREMTAGEETDAEGSGHEADGEGGTGADADGDGGTGHEADGPDFLSQRELDVLVAGPALNGCTARAPMSLSDILEARTRPSK